MEGRFVLDSKKSTKSIFLEKKARSFEKQRIAVEEKLYTPCEIQQVECFLATSLVFFQLPHGLFLDTNHQKQARTYFQEWKQTSFHSTNTATNGNIVGKDTLQMQWNKEFREQVRLFRRGMHTPVLGEFEQANGGRRLFVVERDNTLVVCEKDGGIVEGFDHLFDRVHTTYTFVQAPIPYSLEGKTTATNKRRKLAFSEMYEKKKVSEEKKEKKRQASLPTIQEQERDRWIQRVHLYKHPFHALWKDKDVEQPNRKS